MDNLATIEKTFFVEALLLWIFEYRKLEDKRETFKHCIVIEEAHHIVSKKKERTAGEETVIETILRMIREFGESVIVIDQEPQKVSDSILANTNCKICFTLGNGKDVSTIGKAMNLSIEENGMIDKLKTGHAIIKNKRFDEPIHVKFPHIKIKKGQFVNDE
jgi:DNA helicase HerA-like ATPase